MPEFGAAPAARRQHDQLEEEREQLEEEARRLQSQLEASQALLPVVTDEFAHAEAWAQEEAAAADAAEFRRSQLLLEWEELAAYLPRNAENEEHTEVTLAQAEQLRHEEEAEQLMQKVSHHESELAHLESGKDQMEALEAAEAVTAEINGEIAELRAELEKAEKEGSGLVEEQAAVEAESGPIHDWVNHVGEQLKLAREENSELSLSLAAALQNRADLERDQSEVQPLRQAGLDVVAITWLQEHERNSAARKAVLLEEISAEKLRRRGLLSEVQQHRQETVAEERLEENKGRDPPQWEPLLKKESPARASDRGGNSARADQGSPRLRSATATRARGAPQTGGSPGFGSTTSSGRLKAAVGKNRPGASPSSGLGSISVSSSSEDIDFD